MVCAALGDVEVKGARVPAYSYSIATDTPWADTALYKMPYIDFSRPCRRRGAGQCARGVGRRHRMATQKRAMGQSRVLAERSGVQAALAEAEAEWRALMRFDRR